MDGGDDGPPVPSEVLDGLDDEEGGRAVEAASRLVEEHETGAGEDLEGDADPLLLSAAYPSPLPVADLPIAAILEAHLHDGPLHHFSDLVPAHGAREPQVC